jgi:hypothetical protein
MIFSMKWIATATVAITLGIEPLALSANAAMLERQTEPIASSVNTVAIEPAPVLLAESSRRKTKKSRKRPNRKVKSKQSKVAPTSQSVIDTGSQLELDGRGAAYECIINGSQPHCRRFVEIKNSLMSLSLQNLGQGYSLYYSNLSSYEAYLHVSKGMGDSAK